MRYLNKKEMNRKMIDKMNTILKKYHINPFPYDYENM